MLILFLPLILLLLLLAEQLLYRRFWSRGLSAALSFAEEAVDEGAVTALTEVVTHRAALPLPVVAVHFQLHAGLFVENGENVTVSDRTNVTDVFSLSFYERITRCLPVVCKKRGYYTVEQTSLTSSDLFGRELLYINEAQRTHLSVYPRPFQEERLAIPLDLLLGELARRRSLSMDPFSFRGIRAYTPADPMRSINWKASARAGELLVNERESTGGRRVLLFFNADPPAILYDETLLEEGLRLARSLAERLCAEGIPSGFFSNGADILTGESARFPAGTSPAEPAALPEILARIDLHRRTAFSAVVADALAAEPSGITCVFISTSQRDETAECFLRARTATSSAIWFCPLRADMEIRGDIPGLEAVSC